MASDKITTTHVLVPLALISFVLASFLGFQTSLLITDRDTLAKAHVQQDKPLAQVEKIKVQLNALAVGTLKLAQGGNKDAANIMSELRKAGVDVNDQAQVQGGQQGAPGQMGSQMQQAPQGAMRSMAPGAPEPGGDQAPQ
jgi:hypothetical protein